MTNSHDFPECAAQIMNNYRTKTRSLLHAPSAAAALLGVLVGASFAAPATGDGHGSVKRYTDVSEIPHQGLLIDHRDSSDVAARLASGDRALVRARDAVIGAAEDAMDVPIRAITDGKDDPNRVAPSGDPREYVSLSPYWWPDPNVPSGKPYVRRDGEINPERHEFDTPKLGAMGTAVRELAWGYAVTGDERYAERAASHLRTWFVDPETRMNPSMNYAQFVPGVALGRPYGIIDTNRLRWVPDAAVILLGSEHWSEEDHRAFQSWCSEYVDWLLTSELGKAERRGKNNHGTWYAAQVALYSLFAGRDDVAREMIESIPARIDDQIEPSGTQPYETERTRALDYIEFNVRGLMDLAIYADRLGIDLANYSASDGGSIRGAIDYGLPYWLGDAEWPYQQISEPRRHMYYQTLRRAARMYDEPAYERAARRIADSAEGMSWMEFLIPPKHDLDN